MLYFCHNLYGIINMYELIRFWPISTYEYLVCYFINKKIPDKGEK